MAIGGGRGGGEVLQFDSFRDGEIGEVHRVEDTETTA